MHHSNFRIMRLCSSTRNQEATGEVHNNRQLSYAAAGAVLAGNGGKDGSR